MTVRRFIAALGLVGTLSACADGISTPETAATGHARKAIDPATGTAYLNVRGTSYTSTWGEVKSGTCSGLYQWQTSTSTVGPAGNQFTVQETKLKKVGCGLQASTAGEPVVGGEVSMALYYNGSFFTGDVMKADGLEVAELSGIPAGATMDVTAAPWGGFGFVEWTITRADGTQYREYTPTLTRNANSTDVTYHAVFKEGYTTGGGGGGGGGGGIDTCDDPTVPGCEDGN